MNGLLNNSILRMAYAGCLEYPGLFIGYSETESNGTFHVDIIKESKITDSFHVSEVKYIGERYLVMELVSCDKTKIDGIEVLDTLTKEKLTDKLSESGIYWDATGFMCDPYMPRAAIISRDANKIKYAILNDETFEVINKEFIGVRKASIKDNFYSFEGVMTTDPTMWRHVIMDKETGDVLESVRVGINMG